MRMDDLDRALESNAFVRYLGILYAELRFHRSQTAVSTLIAPESGAGKPPAHPARWKR